MSETPDLKNWDFGEFQQTMGGKLYSDIEILWAKIEDRLKGIETRIADIEQKLEG